RGAGGAGGGVRRGQGDEIGVGMGGVVVLVEEADAGGPRARAQRKPLRRDHLMFASHYPTLFSAYAVALAGWWIIQRFVRLWPASPPARFEHPLREFLYALLGGVGVLLVGFLLSRGVRLPEAGPLGPFAAAFNQLFVFSPALLVPVIRRHSRDTVWCGGSRIPHRALTGLVIGAASILAYSLLRADAAPV